MTLFGMSEKKKRGIIVPVMALAVCAVAMVGLGFALQTSVSSSNNVVGQLMIDLDEKVNGFDSDGPDTSKVDALLSPAIRTVKTGGDSPVVTKYLDSKVAYMKIYGNITDDIKLKVDVTGMGSGKVESLTLTVKEGETTIATANVSYPNVNSTFVMESDQKFVCNGVYSVQVTAVDGVNVGSAWTNSSIDIVGSVLGFTFTAEAW